MSEYKEYPPERLGDALGKPEIILYPLNQELKAPVKDLITKLDKLFFLFGKVTRPSTVKAEDHDPQTPIKRSLITRTVRAELLKEFRSIPKSDTEGRKKIISKAHEWDRLAKQFLRQGEIRVTIPDLGEQVARYNILNPQKEPQQIQDKPPIVIIPGISNDLDCIAAIAQSLAYSGRTVISIGYPESFMGRVTDEFAETVGRKKYFSEHAKFFQLAMQSLTKDSQAIELWGLSTGAPIAAELLANPTIQEKVSDAVLISPAGCVEQSSKMMKMGIALEIVGLLKNFGSVLPRFVMTTGRKENPDKHQLDLRKIIFNTLLETITHDYKGWNTMRVKEGGSIVVICGGKDQITKSYNAIRQFQANPQVKAALMPEENHMSSFNNIAVLKKIQQLQEGK